MYIIGLTGGIASGKSTVARMLAGRGAHVIDADDVARRVVEPDRPALKELVQTFGREIVTAQGTLDRAALARRIFSDDDARAQVNAIIHPRVRAEFRRRLEELSSLPPSQRPPAVVLDVPLLYEGGAMDSWCDEVWVVWTRRETQLERLCARDGIDAHHAAQRIDSQMPLDEKRELADVVINNDAGLASTERQVDAAWKAVLQREEA